MTAPLLLDLSHTSHTRARTGVQRVARALRAALGAHCTAVCFDPHADAWRPLEGWEEENLGSPEPGGSRGTNWPLGARLRGRFRRAWGAPRAMTRAAQPAGGASGVIVPEIFSLGVAAAYPRLFATTSGPRVALFHDALALQFPEFAPRSTVARFPSYLRELLMFDGVAAVSGASRQTLIDYWAWAGVPSTPEVIALPLGIDPPVRAIGEPPDREPPTVLCVGTIEGRKNHLALLDACESLWARGVRFELQLVGMANTETGSAAMARLERLRSAGRPIRYNGPERDKVLEAAYADCAFTVYPSLCEGFGLPVAESLVRGRPCICSSEGAIGEISSGGGCLSIGSGGTHEIAAAIERLVAAPDERAALAASARGRQFKSWKQYASELIQWISGLKQNA